LLSGAQVRAVTSALAISKKLPKKQIHPHINMMFFAYFFSAAAKKVWRLRGRDRAVLMLSFLVNQDQHRRFSHRQATPFSSIAKKREEKKLL